MLKTPQAPGGVTPLKVFQDNFVIFFSYMEKNSIFGISDFL